MSRGKASRSFETMMVNAVEQSKGRQLKESNYCIRTWGMALIEVLQEIAQGKPLNPFVLRAVIVHFNRIVEATPQEFTPLQDRVGQWSDGEFGSGRVVSVSKLSHMKRELVELSLAFAEGHAADTAKEAADCLILLLGFAHIQGFDLMAEAEDKFAVVQKRTWKAPDSEGVIEHEEGA
jgi:NTP pyrophosphatase (non-canonical NTP hydrolase)